MTRIRPHAELLIRRCGILPVRDCKTQLRLERQLAASHRPRHACEVRFQVELRSDSDYGSLSYKLCHLSKTELQQPYY